ncbi:putative protein YagA [subsurface metagenome]
MERKGVSFYYFRRKPIKLGNRYERWRGVADLLKLKAQERLRVEWMIFYYKEAGENATSTCSHFGISRKTFYKWLNRFKFDKENVESLRDISRRPHKVRTWEVSLLEEARIRELRRKYMYYGKKKLKVLYKKAHNEDISCWKIERVIRRYKLYPDKVRQAGIARKQARSREKPKRRIIQLKKENKLWFLFQIDTIVIYCGNLKRYIITALDHASKLGYARMYKTKSSKVTADFLYRLKYLVQAAIENILIDNGSEFGYHFEKAADRLNIKRYFSRVRTPKDNPECERFNETLEYEWLYNGNLDLDPEKFNPQLTGWLIEYNFNRPHQSLDYLTPIEYTEKELKRIRAPDKVLPMWSASTFT